MSATEGQTIKSVEYCTDCTTSVAADTDEICEDLDGAETITNDGSSARCTGWTATESTGATVSIAAHSGTLACTGKGSYALQSYVIDASDDGSEDSYIEKDLASAEGIIHVQAYINVVSTTMDADGSDQIALLWLRGDSNKSLVRVVAEKDAAGADKYHLELQYREDNSPTNVAKAFSTVCDEGTWYRIGIYWSTGAAAEAYIDTDNDGSWDETEADNGTVDTENVEDIIVGSHSTHTIIANDATTVQFDLIGVDDDAMPSACGT
jgi:hypothetical protein